MLCQKHWNRLPVQSQSSVGGSRLNFSFDDLPTSTVSGDLTGRSLIANTKIICSLGRATQRGVKVYGVVYDDVALPSSSVSRHAVTALEKINPDMIKIMRHPDHLDLETIVDFKDALYWSHHDKAVIIDDKTVFWGGLDSCFGRWDYNAHPLADLHSQIRDEVWLGQDYNDARIMRFSHVDNWKYNMLNRKE